jgi:outer membrane protein OmpA-like peptidoglycan-associated protein
MSSPGDRRVAGAAPTGRAAGTPPQRRRPWWVWLLLILLAVVIIVVILLLATQCGSGSSGGPATPAAGAPPAGAGTPGAPAGAPPAGAPGASGGAAAPGATPPGATAGGTGAGAGGSGAGDVAAVSARVSQILAATPVTFQPDRPELTTAGRQSVDRVARELAAVPAARVSVTGYAAPVDRGVGPNAQSLSDQRAAAVAQRLAADGIGADRVQSHGAADTNPLASTAASRRADITVS